MPGVAVRIRSGYVRSQRDSGSSGGRRLLHLAEQVDGLARAIPLPKASPVTLPAFVAAMRQWVSSRLMLLDILFYSQYLFEEPDDFGIVIAVRV